VFRIFVFLLGYNDEQTIRDNNDDSLRCFLFKGHKDDFFSQLGPWKVEEIAKQPYVVRFFDILYDSEIDSLERLGEEKLARATVFDPATHKLVNADYRVSKSAWLKNEDDETVATYNRRISLLTGLDLEYAEQLQMSNYGIGGQYEPHFDYSRREWDIYNNRRIATWLSYLTTVEQGGGTVFTELGLHIRSIKGSAVFWYNLLPNGSGDERTRHAACPVLRGNKWVSNKWIHEFGNEWNRQCRLDEDADNLCL
jgi:prolyl 4-hydroxylase